MAASYPASVKTFSDIVDGTDFVEATQMNQAYDEIEALETMVGATGSATGHTDSILSAFREYRHGAKVIADTVAQVKVQAGEVVCVDASGNVKLRRNTGVTTVTWANIDTGAEAASKRYYVHAVADTAATTFTVEISLSSTAPDGVTTFKLLGSFYNNSGSDIEDVMDDLHLLHREPGAIEAWPTDVAPGGAILCDGAATVGTTVDPTLADLYAVIGIVYGGADATDFQVPDLRGRTIIGLDDMGQGSANRVTAAAADAPAGVGGTETHTLTATQSGTTAHTHVIKQKNAGAVGSANYPINADTDTNSNPGVTDASTAASAASAHPNTQPWMALAYIIWK